jgi:hypothetical protein
MQERSGTLRSAVATLVAALVVSCASIPMTETDVIAAPKPDTVLVTFVRQSIWMGDGIPVDIWDGNHYVGVLAAGGLVQYETTPGKHLFLGNAENWSYATGDLIAGKQYFVKANMFPGVTMRVAWVAVESTDARIPQWQSSWTANKADEAKRAAFEAKQQVEIEAAIQEFKDGKVTSFAELRSEHAL